MLTTQKGADGRNPDRPLLAHHVAAMCGMSITAIRWNARRGLLKGFRSPGTPKIWRFWREDVESFRRGGRNVL